MIRISIPNFLKALLLSGSFFSLALLYGRSNFYRDPGSVFFDQSRAFETKYSVHREHEAIAFYDAIVAALRDHENGNATKGLQSAFMKAGPAPTICLTFPTIARETNKQYLDLAVTSTLVDLTPAERADLDVRIYFANTDPVVHPSWQTVLSNISDETYSARTTATKSQLDHLETLEGEQNFQAKGSLDYATALQHCYDNSTAPYIAIFEDDILVADGWLPRTLLALQDIETQMVGMGQAQDEWLFMRLFNEERASGWASRALLGNNVPLISVGIAVAFASILVYVRDYRKGGNKMLGRRLDNATLFVVCGITVPAFVILFFQAGKASMLPPGPGVRMEDFGCCTQAMVFPRRQVPGLIEQLLESAERAVPYDMAMDQHARKAKIKRFALYPVQAQHVGSRSVINPNRRDENRVWSMAFESLSPWELHADHERMAEFIYGS